LADGEKETERENCEEGGKRRIRIGNKKGKNETAKNKGKMTEMNQLDNRSMSGRKKRKTNETVEKSNNER
jgi:hypothetical protein